MTSAVVHLELHTPDLGRACEFYGGLLGWRPRRIRAADATYHWLDLGTGIGGGVQECGTKRELWLPYVEVGSVAKATARAVELGGSTMLAPREGPAGWRSVVRTPTGGEIAFWHGKR
jgi:predicted enzyme related to lactoylglutathione lyase